MTGGKLLKLEITGTRTDEAVKDPAYITLVDLGWRTDYGWISTEAPDEPGTGPTRQYLMLLLVPPSASDATALDAVERVEQVMHTLEHTMKLEAQRGRLIVFVYASVVTLAIVMALAGALL